MPLRKIMIIDEDKSSSELLKAHLERENCSVLVVSNPIQWRDKFDPTGTDLVITDVVFQNIDGWQMCKDIRALSNCPIMVLSYKSDTFAKVLGFELGIDDYVTKPFDIKELVARTKALVRRYTIYNATKDSKKSQINFENLHIDMESYELLVKSKPKSLPPKEMGLLFLLASNPNKVFSRNELLDKIWGFDYYGDSRTVDVHIKRLRLKLDNISNKWGIKTVWGIGYKFDVPQEPSLNSESKE